MGSLGSINASVRILVLFDGVCNLCNGAVQFIIKRDPESKFRFASLQSDFGKSQLAKFGFEATALETIVVVENDTIFQRSEAVLRITSHLSSIWPIFTIFKFVPHVIRDGIYNIIAAYRYKIFGRNEKCMIPAPGLKNRFLDAK
ncbi:MAG: DCC1-like thiol-disulfide oxidoreductase family protein [Cyclobacteriaceae bacterium]|nr:DCC1-like thiol-disulfide oxidoreductase family protein [Cyclobacteriaceae bacterium]MDH4296983.1 DCC1-like thiol-disulfide oxidoreductase family protein [Cyclobacteriaceae bacterium]MDH5250248.1 DCC1-like thiol-disulfide oxidoreductase family protein [Cyclobacteriaceae bacterium]